jgi:glucosamine-6-phosphate deaminase
MEIIIQPDPELASLTAARIVARIVSDDRRTVLGLATGKTPLRLYAELAKMHRDESLDFHRVTTFNLDEYVGLPPEHPSSYHSFMNEHLFRHINIDTERAHIPNGMTDDIPETCSRYERDIRESGGIDLQILGVGRHGHIGFNEPSSSLASRTRIKTLTEMTRSDNAEEFGGVENVPRHVITMGIGTIMDSGMCLLLAFGKRKAAAVAQAVEGPVSAMVPASVLQMHEHATVVADEGAASELRLADYYRHVFEQKPEWQRP